MHAFCLAVFSFSESNNNQNNNLLATRKITALKNVYKSKYRKSNKKLELALETKYKLTALPTVLIVVRNVKSKQSQHF